MSVYIVQQFRESQGRFTFINTGMLFQLKRFIHQGGARQTQQVVSRVIRMTIETGTLTGIYPPLTSTYNGVPMTQFTFI